MFALSFECGITTSSWYAEFAFRRRVNMSAIGSVIVMVTCQTFSPWFLGFGCPGKHRGLERSGGGAGVDALPAGLVDARQFAAVRHLAQADPAQADLAVHGVRTAALLAAGVGTVGEL